MQMSWSSNGRGGHTQQERNTSTKKFFSKILEDTAHRRKRGQLDCTVFTQVKCQHSHCPKQDPYFGARGNAFLHSPDLTTDTVLWEYMCRVGNSLAEKAVLKIISEYDHRDRTNQLRSSIEGLEERINGGQERHAALKVVKTILRSKTRQLVDH